ncbi:multiple epidermal growth factor-like domains protein 11 [Haliotis cracherodii]|uniref:multiple epidermal growth factor-like domains protein 11 n=1 Tax=Haliotis cracherodii TaxID=6455 RepID=UPI0039ED5263
MDLTCDGTGRFFIIRNPGRAPRQYDDTLNICEVEIYECSGGTFGPNCSEFCHCLNSTCDHVTGACPGGCRPGWKGDNCSTRCSVGSYGINCQKSCSNRKCTSDSSSCDRRSGSCDTGCRAGWKQSDCTQECDGLHYGTNCRRACADKRCALNTSWCDHVTGICDTGVCQAGRKGIACTEAAPSKTTSTVVIVSCSVGVLVLLLVAVGVVVWRTKRRTIQNHQDDIHLHEVPAEDLSPETAEEPTRSTYASLGDRSEADNRQYEALRVTGSDMYINC